MNITQYTPRVADDLSVVVDGAETIQIYQPDSGSLLTVPNCVAQTIKANKAPSESPQGATVLEREWNCPVAPMSRQKMEGGNETTNGAKPHGQKDKVLPPNELREAARAIGRGYASEYAGLALPTSNWEPPLSAALPASNQEPTLSGGVTQFAEGEPNTLNSASCSPNGGAKPRGQKDKVMPPKKPFLALPTSKQEPTLSGVIPFASLTSLPPSNHSRLASINDIIIDSHDQQWRIVSIELKERIGRVVYRARQIDLSPRLDEWVDILTPIYQTDDNGAPYIYKYQLDLTGVSVRIIRVPVSSHRQLIDVPEERIEIIFADSAIHIGAQQRIRLADGSIYKPTDLFPITQTRPALRVIAQRES